MMKVCVNCGHEETDDAYYCSHCRGRISITSVFDGTTPKMCDERASEPPYIELSFLGTWAMTRDEFFARTYLIIASMLAVTLVGLVFNNWIVGPVYSGGVALIWYAVWKEGS